MKLTRKKLRQLIEAFISGPLGTKHIPDEDYPYNKLERDFGDKAVALANIAHSSPEGEAQYEELAGSFGGYDDFVDETREMLSDYDLDKDIGYTVLSIIKEHQAKDPELRYKPKRHINRDYSISITFNTPNQSTLKSIVQEVTMIQEMIRSKRFGDATFSLPRIIVSPHMDGNRKASEYYPYTAGKPYGERYLLMIAIGTTGLNSNAS